MDNEVKTPQDQPAPVFNIPREELSPVMRFSDWLLLMVIMLIPVVNVVMLFVWAFDTSEIPISQTGQKQVW